MPGLLGEIRALFDANPVYHRRTKRVAYLDLAGCMALGVTGPILRSTGLPWDLRKSQPYCGYETYDFDVPVVDTCDAYGRYLVRMDEMTQSLRIIRQCVDRLAERGSPGPDQDPVMIRDAKIGWAAPPSLGPGRRRPPPPPNQHNQGPAPEAAHPPLPPVPPGVPGAGRPACARGGA